MSSRKSVLSSVCSSLPRLPRLPKLASLFPAAITALSLATLLCAVPKPAMAYWQTDISFTGSVERDNNPTSCIWSASSLCDSVTYSTYLVANTSTQTYDLTNFDHTNAGTAGLDGLIEAGSGPFTLALYTIPDPYHYYAHVHVTVRWVHTDLNNDSVISVGEDPRPSHRLDRYVYSHISAEGNGTLSSGTPYPNRASVYIGADTSDAINTSTDLHAFSHLEGTFNDSSDSATDSHSDHVSLSFTNGIPYDVATAEFPILIDNHADASAMSAASWSTTYYSYFTLTPANAD